jgi:hypothetical protein
VPLFRENTYQFCYLHSVKIHCSFTSVPPPKAHRDTGWISILFSSLFRKEFWRHSACGDTAGAIGHSVGKLNDVHRDRSSTVDWRAALVVGLLLSDGTVLIEADNVVIGIVGAGDRDGLYVNLGVEPNELARAAFNGARMGCNLGAYLWLTTRSLSAFAWCKRVLLLVVVVCASIVWLCVVRVWCCVEWFLDGCGKWNSY